MNTIRELRKKKGLTQQELGEYLGVQKTAISYYESGKRQPTPDMLMKMADLFGVSVDVILGREDQPAEAPGWKDASEVTAKPSPPRFPLPDLDHETARIPILGSVHAGYDYMAEENYEGYLEVDPAVKQRHPDAYVVQVKGDSMEPEIRHGAIAICVPSSEYRSGCLALVSINGDEATVKRLKINGDGITLIPANPCYKTIHYTPEDVQSLPVQIRAKVIEIRNNYEE